MSVSFRDGTQASVAEAVKSLQKGADNKILRDLVFHLRAWLQRLCQALVASKVLGLHPSCRAWAYEYHPGILRSSPFQMASKGPFSTL